MRSVSTPLILYVFFPPSQPSSSALLGRTRLRLQPHELLGHVVVGALGEDPHGGEAGIIHVDALAQRTPAGAVALPCDVS